jgi:hypothetical protein
MKILAIAFTKVTSISIHHLSSCMIYKRCHMTCEQVVEHNPPTKTKEHENLVLPPRATSQVTSYQSTC